MINSEFKVVVTPGQWGRGMDGEASTESFNSIGDVLFLTLGD